VGAGYEVVARALPPSPQGGDDHGPDGGADAAAGPELESVTAHEAGQEAADEGPHETGHEPHGPVDALAAPAQDELCGRADQHAERMIPMMSRAAP
jgi:hypothetical protein